MNFYGFQSIPARMKMLCPSCRQATPWEGNPYRPFCSEQCKRKDLGKWATEQYKISNSEDEEEDEKDENSDPE